MSLSVDASNVSRQQLLQVYQSLPESAPLKIPALVSTAAAEDYRFEKLMARFASPTAGGLVDEAKRDAEMVRQGAGAALSRGCVALFVGMASLFATISIPLLFIVGLVGIYFGMTWIRQGNDKRRQSDYDRKFAADVIRYAGQAAAVAGGENAVWQQE